MDFLKDIFWNIPLDFWQDGFWGKLLSSLWLTMLALVMLLGLAGAYWLVNNSFLSYEEAQATIVDKRYEPAHSQTSMSNMMVGNINILVPQTVYYAEKYVLKLQVGELSGSVDVVRSLFEELSIGSIIKVKYAKKRLSDELSFQ